MSRIFTKALLFSIPVFFHAGKSPKINIDNPQEKHLKNLRQLTFGGDNAEAYFSPDGKWLTFQSNYKKWNLSCDQIFLMNIKAANDSSYMPKRISNAEGRTTCSFFMPDGKHILFASTFKHGKAC